MELSAPLLLAEMALPAYEQPLSPPAPPGPVHQFPEPVVTTGQAGMEGRAEGSNFGQEGSTPTATAAAIADNTC